MREDQHFLPRPFLLFRDKGVASGPPVISRLGSRWGQRLASEPDKTVPSTHIREPEWTKASLLGDSCYGSVQLTGLSPPGPLTCPQLTLKT